MKRRFKRRRGRKFTQLNRRRRISSGYSVSIARKWGALRRSSYYFKHWG
ncbi:MAG: hypothetical protein V3U91_04995 [Candidatus Aminicenantaceae bacterium]